MRHVSALLVVGLSGLLFGCHAPDAGGRRPNLILILADDAGYADFGFQDVTNPDMAGLTPAIDSIAAEGARFTDFYMAGTVCSPSRAGLMTGRYQQRFGHERNLPAGYMKGGLSLDEQTLAEHLGRAGYATGCVGKWHLGYPDAYHPNARGFDEFFGLIQGARTYLPYAEPSRWKVLQLDGEPTPDEGYVTDRLGEAAVRFVREQGDQPFFLYVSFTAPHGPLQPRPEDLEQPWLTRIENKRRSKYAGLVKAMDDNVARLLAALEDEGLADDTLVLFTNDNGGQTSTGAVNTPLRGRKGTLWEGGVRVPCALRWPGHVEPGTVVTEPLIALDLMPSFLAAAGAPVDDEWALDGLDFLPALQGRSLPGGSQRPLFWRHNGREGAIAIRRGRWKLVQETRSEPPALFDLSTDISETTDVSAGHPEVVDELAAQLADWEAELIDPLWEY